MQAAELISYIRNPHLLTEKSVEPLQKLVDDFPYFQAGHILLSLASKQWNVSVYQQNLRKTAITVTNRSHLFNLIHATQQAATEGTQAHVAEQPAGAVTEVVTSVIEKAEYVPENPQSLSDTKHEIDILKAAELLAEKTVPKLPVPESDLPLHSLTETKINEQIEKEIGRQLVTSFIEKEIIKTPELHTVQVKKEDTPASFAEWLSLLKSRSVPAVRQSRLQTALPKEEQPETGQKTEEPDVSQKRKQKNRAIIDKIIENNPGLIKTKEQAKFYSPDSKAKESLQDNEHLVTETLAKIYALQGNVNKAVRAYEILSLKFPQKSAYFASLIKKLKNNK